MKFARQAKILNLIEEHEIETQEELTEYLRQAGHSTTQATVSRDIKELCLVKVMSPETGHYRYSSHASDMTENCQVRLRNIFRECVTSITPAQNLVVIKTLPGLAQAAAVSIDALRVQGMLGTLGGDDTVLCILKTSEEAERFVKDAHEMLN